MCVCSVKKSDSKPRSSVMRASSAGAIEYAVGKMAMPNFTRGSLPAGASVRVVAGKAGGGGRARLLGERRDRERAARGLLEHRGSFVGRAGVQLDEHVDDDLVAVVLVEAEVREE